MRWGTLENVYMEIITMSMSGRKNPVLRIVADIIERKEKRKMLDRVGKLAMAGKENQDFKKKPESLGLLFLKTEEIQE